MRIFLIALCLLYSSEALAQAAHEFYPVDSTCIPSREYDNEPKEPASCSTHKRPLASEYTDSSWHKKDVMFITPLRKADRLVPLRPVTAEAAPQQ